MSYYTKSNNSNYEFQSTEKFATQYDAAEMVDYLEYMGCSDVVLMGETVFFNNAPKGPYQRACEDFAVNSSPEQEHNEYVS